MVTKGSLQWYTFYDLMLGLAVVELLILTASFRLATGTVHRALNPHISTKSRSRITEALRNPITSICALFLLAYVGVEVSLGGWLVTFMLRVRHGSPFSSGLVVTGFWLGITFGRMCLGFVTGKIGEKVAISVYLLVAMGSELCFWLIPSFVSSAVFAGIVGFWLGPMFPAAIVVATKLLPRRLHVSAIGFAAAFGGGGMSFFHAFVLHGTDGGRSGSVSFCSRSDCGSKGCSGPAADRTGAHRCRARPVGSVAGRIFQERVGRVCDEAGWSGWGRGGER